MAKSTKVALIGISVGIAIAAVGYIGLEYSKTRVAELVTHCQSESKRESVSVEAWRSENRGPGLPRMGTADDYAEWIVANEEKKGSSEFEAVAKAYKMLRDGPLVCDPATLQQLRNNESHLAVVQDQILETQRVGKSWSDGALMLASIVALLTAIPYIWYFFPRRVREVRDAVVGK